MKCVCNVMLSALLLEGGQQGFVRIKESPEFLETLYSGARSLKRGLSKRTACTLAILTSV